MTGWLLILALAATYVGVGVYLRKNINYLLENNRSPENLVALGVLWLFSPGFVVVGLAVAAAFLPLYLAGRLIAGAERVAGTPR